MLLDTMMLEAGPGWNVLRHVKAIFGIDPVSDAPSQSDRDWLKAMGKVIPERLWHPVGCEHCKGMGYSGRTGIFETWRVGPDDAGRILEEYDDQKNSAASVGDRASLHARRRSR
jgi:type II secretory ATPase GspE/PulE/Tfp pilus assembly ATPase PilB-like protein